MVEPPAKRRKTAPSLPVQGNRMLHQTMLVVLFLVRVSGRSTDPVTASLFQIGRMVDRAFHRYHGMITGQLESFQEQINDLHREVRQLTRIFSNRNTDQQTRKRSNQEEHAAAEGSNTNTKLCFLNALSQPVYTQKNVTAEDNSGIKVAMFEGNTKVTSGLLSKVKVEILVLRGDFNNCRDNWTGEEFDAHIVQGRDGKDLVLGTAWLSNGEVEHSQIRFPEGSCRTPSRKFILAARVCKSEKMAIRVHEAIMKPVTVLDRRNEPNKKSHPPRLCEDVYRLEKIAKDGDYHKRLKNAQIYTVEDFLKALNKNPDDLSKVLQMKRQCNSWLKLTKHAREYILEDRQELKPYISEDRSVMLLFNCVYDLVGAMLDGVGYVASENFDSSLKIRTNKLKEEVHNILDRIPSSYVMKDNIPEEICTANDLAHDEINHVTQPSYPNENYHPGITAPVDLIMPYYEVTPQQQIVTPSIVPQLNPQSLRQAYPLELASTQWFQQDGTSGASTSSQPNTEPHHLPQLHQTMTTVPQPQW